MSTVSIRNTGGTDYLSFDAVGLPGFQFIQDPLDYGTLTHHSDVDTYDYLQGADLMQAAVIATVVYDASNRPEMLPRKPLPKAWPKPEAVGYVGWDPLVVTGNPGSCYVCSEDTSDWALSSTAWAHPWRRRPIYFRSRTET